MLLRVGEDGRLLLRQVMKALGICGLMLAGAVAALGAEPWTLERAIQQALAGNPDARLAQQRIVAAQAGLEQAKAAFWPQLQFQSSYTVSDNPMQVFGGVLNQRAYSTDLNFNNVPTVDDLNTRGLVTMPLYAGGKNVALRKAATASADAARQDSAAIRNALGLEVARGFYAVLKTRQFTKAAEAAVKALEGSLAVAKKRFEAGSLLKSGVLDIEVRLAQAREELVRARNANALALRALRNLLGIESGEFDVADSAPALSAPESGDFSGRAELAAARHRERAAEQQVQAAKGHYLPRVSAFGSADYDYGWKYDHGGDSYTGGALLQWDLWDGKLTKAKVAEANASLAAAREEVRKVKLALDLEVEQARLELKAANERLSVTEQAVAQAAESESITRARFEQEQALATDLIDSEAALLAARVRRAEAEADQRVAIAAARKALGLPQL